MPEDASSQASYVSVLNAAPRAGRGEDGPVHFYTRFYNFRFSWMFEALWHHPQAATATWVQARCVHSVPARVRLGDFATALT